MNVRHVKKGLRASLRNNGQAYGFSVSITAAMALLNSRTDVTGAAPVVYFALASAAAFSLLEAVASHGFRTPLDEEPRATTALGISLSLASVGTSTCLAWLVADTVGGVPAWPLTGFLVATAYPLAAGVELAVAERAREKSGQESEKQQEGGPGGGEGRDG
ncbi:hypothetical protein [Streptomyces sp. CC210A]|uniref:hypothetical protein n=1 Tax=Streptomyces sp. CC210A TaxID=2898184 RepID=UPI001F42DAF7|nr:hypothetical protein [Streptomyces sp. CC210A]